MGGDLQIELQCTYVTFAPPNFLFVFAILEKKWAVKKGLEEKMLFEVELEAWVCHI